MKNTSRFEFQKTMLEKGADELVCLGAIVIIEINNGNFIKHFHNKLEYNYAIK
ncbi:hypothetical protein [Candidatus Marithrix sp. Canyon 246]|uniref:hypothetical protein n=1 Tax=Candidatus Marithrix sp. Canyon 246 TaxID=1827136 RepID=UPI001495DD3D|nr:hypothetical protein [Candidatus Marithrix sp. Canyon 246]